VDNLKTEFELLYKKYFSQVYSYVMTLSRNQDIAEEITQKTFVKALTSYDKFEGKSSEFTWLCAIARNMYIDDVRVQKKAESLPAIEVELASDNDEQIFQIHKALHSLPDPYKEVFHLRVFGDLSFEKIGKLFGKTANWACVTYHRARLKIKENMEET